ncbi:DNA polymerase IV [Apibacter muscae]|uniref:DNA polymerase IV n=1 Tax=Apibacter muscae TaxID=2509004 RepID=UPI0011AB9AD9|nr:DNA polymerase IV [Apibacter muscae]TWP29510.1 DNA polymerase IV [Apibacter muscae]
MRKIIHIDMDAFYASIEQRDNKEYRNKPLVVGSSGVRGVVAAASYEARKYGIKSAMASQKAMQLCPNIIFVQPRFEVYKSVSKQIKEIFLKYTDKVEPLSLDEAFLDVTENYMNEPYAMEVAKKIKSDIFKETNLTASAGVSFNKFLAKIASDYNKPNGLFIITPKKAEKFVGKLKVESFFGIGKKTSQKLHELGIYTGWDLKQKTEDELIRYFGKQGRKFYLNAKGIDHGEVNPNRIRKSLGAENTFRVDTNSLEFIYLELKEICKEVIERIKKVSFKGKTITLKVRYENFKIVSKSKTLSQPVTDYSVLYKSARELLHELDLSNKVRLIGISIKNMYNIETDTTLGHQLEIPFEV